MPCLDEEESIGQCIRMAKEGLDRTGARGEIVIADNGSTDGSREIARELGARVVDVPDRGYGAALMGGFEAAHGRYVIMGDADGSYDFGHIEGFLERLRAGDDLVMGNRFRGGIEEGAMPFLHRYLGNPVLSFVGRLLFPSAIGDFHCGLRGFRREILGALDLQSPGMEFASEMVVKATLSELRISEVPTTLSPDLRSRPPHLRTWRDGWRHLRFLLLFSPRWLFFYPGLALMAIGLVATIALLPGELRIFGIGFDVHTLVYASAMIVVGYQAMLFAVFARQAVDRGPQREAQPRGGCTRRPRADRRRPRDVDRRPLRLGRLRLRRPRLPRDAAPGRAREHDADPRRADRARQLLHLDPRDQGRSRPRLIATKARHDGFGLNDVPSRKSPTESQKLQSPWMSFQENQ
jgi:glycosyltransferase involved in cell wall biosynthesis